MRALRQVSPPLPRVAALGDSGGETRRRRPAPASCPLRLPPSPFPPPSSPELQTQVANFALLPAVGGRRSAVEAGSGFPHAGSDVPRCGSSGLRQGSLVGPRRCSSLPGGSLAGSRRRRLSLRLPRGRRPPGRPSSCSARDGAGCLILQLLFLSRVPVVLRPRVRFMGVGIVGAAARPATGSRAPHLWSWRAPATATWAGGRACADTLASVAPHPPRRAAFRAAPWRRARASTRCAPPWRRCALPPTLLLAATAPPWPGMWHGGCSPVKTMSSIPDRRRWHLCVMCLLGALPRDTFMPPLLAHPDDPSSRIGRCVSRDGCGASCSAQGGLGLGLDSR